MGQPISDPLVRHLHGLTYSLLLEVRGISVTELALELDCSRFRVYRLLKFGPRTEDAKERIDLAIDSISRRRGIAPKPATRIISPPDSSGLPEVVFPRGTLMDLLEDIRTEDLMQPSDDA